METITTLLHGFVAISWWSLHSVGQRRLGQGTEQRKSRVQSFTIMMRSTWETLVILETNGSLVIAKKPSIMQLPSLGGPKPRVC